MVTPLPLPAGSKVWSARAVSVVHALDERSRPRTSMLWVRRSHAASGFSLTTTAVTKASAPRRTVSVAG
ncbi:hypothetical protein C1C94_0029880 [Streptomyces sp. SMS_SU21]|nr:hypothetical protein [Streptomyces sp. SMS_SU21]MCA2204922.1 hypothetical protein [Streptomyces sp. SMS_SU21]